LCLYPLRPTGSNAAVATLGAVGLCWGWQGCGPCCQPSVCVSVSVPCVRTQAVCVCGCALHKAVGAPAPEPCSSHADTRTHTCVYVCCPPCMHVLKCTNSVWRFVRALCATVAAYLSSSCSQMHVAQLPLERPGRVYPFSCTLLADVLFQLPAWRDAVCLVCHAMYGPLWPSSRVAWRST
jgi:hypothetical protein